MSCTRTHDSDGTTFSTKTSIFSCVRKVPLYQTGAWIPSCLYWWHLSYSGDQFFAQLRNCVSKGVFWRFCPTPEGPLSKESSTRSFPLSVETMPDFTSVLTSAILAGPPRSLVPVYRPRTGDSFIPVLGMADSAIAARCLMHFHLINF